MKDDQVRYYAPYIGPFDPCPPIRIKSYNVPPQLFIPFQPPNLQQFQPADALRLGTLWPALYSPYSSKQSRIEEGDNDAEATG
ncbi:spore coat associated protein CotJA [Paenibacillus harenae]|uniref:Spore coat protein JA n=1 Tax=Paenibacillus harenae TaxID=306543 RepID=A0ABT9TVP6_PAEHA|nr:spore coat associated protein CotJA [Paenibacillus harenae]MDQ0058097.1 spore coat protein JA [Paenibacillus harenae]MDQ0111442.1 spore coat protein JA [Paenibacillus harenae]